MSGKDSDDQQSFHTELINLTVEVAHLLRVMLGRSGVLTGCVITFRVFGSTCSSGPGEGPFREGTLSVFIVRLMNEVGVPGRNIRVEGRPLSWVCHGHWL